MPKVCQNDGKDRYRMIFHEIVRVSFWGDLDFFNLKGGDFESDFYSFSHTDDV